MTKRILASLAILLLSSFFITPSASAWWRVDTAAQLTLERMEDEGLLYVTAEDYFVINADEINNLQQPIDTSDKYAVVVDGRIIKSS